MSEQERVPSAKEQRHFRIWVIVVTLGLMVAGSGFVFKLVEFIRVAQNQDAEGFAVVPVVMYFLVTSGFICVFIWNYLRGGLRDVEKPKYKLLERHDEIDRHDNAIGRASR
jgi:hypothetical protein